MKTTELKTFQKFKTHSGEIFQVLPTVVKFEKSKYREILQISNKKKYIEKEFESLIIEVI
jgi:hypothetical protein